MEFIHRETMVPMHWTHYAKYDINSVQAYIEQLAPDYSDEILREIRTRVLCELDTDFWEPYKKSQLIFPAPNATFQTYNVWTDAGKPKSFDDFANLFRNGNPPEDKDILKWVTEYGVPYVNIPPALLEPAWNSRTKSARNLQRALKFSQIFRTVIDKSLFKNQPTAGSRPMLKGGIKLAPYGNHQNLAELSNDYYQRTRHIMLKDVFNELAKDAHGANYWFYSLINGQMPSLDPDEEQLLFPLSNPLPRHITPETIPIEIWKALRDRVLARIQGVNVTFNMQRKIEKPPHIEVCQAYVADDLLAVMWTRFYNRLLKLTPARKCRCGYIFPLSRSDKKYCGESCQNAFNQKNFRDRKKEQSHSPSTNTDPD